MTPLYWATIHTARAFFRYIYRHKVYGLEHFVSGGAILAANHTSFFDPPILSCSSPEEVHFLATEYLFHVPILGWIIRRLNTHPVSGDVGDVAVFKMICGLLKEGKKVVIFPEGSRTEKDELSPIKPGISLFLSRTGCAIIPAYIHGVYNIWNRFRKFPKLWGKTACVFGSPIYWEEFASLEKKEAQKAVAERLFRSIQDLRLWYESGAKGIPP
jgi:1-acyl-sn-glycerol-3-phosphate acyltransferase